MRNPPLLIERRAQQAFTITTTRAHGDHLGPELTSLLRQSGLRCSETCHGYAVTPDADWSSLVSHVVTVVGAAGGLGGIAAILKAFLGRHKGTSVKFGENGEVLQADGLSVDDVVRLLDECSLRMPPDLVVRDACGTGESAEFGPDQIFAGDEEFERAMIEARRRSRQGSPQEVVAYIEGEPRVIRRYEDGHEVPRRPGCPAWCDTAHYGPHGLRVSHLGTIGTIAQPDGAEGIVRVYRDHDGQPQVIVAGNEPPRPARLPGGLDGLRPSLYVSAKGAVRLAGLVDLLGHADLAEHLRNAAATIPAATPNASPSSLPVPPRPGSSETRQVGHATFSAPIGSPATSVPHMPQPKRRPEQLETR